MTPNLDAVADGLTSGGEAAHFLSLSSTLYELIDDRQLRYVKRGRARCLPCRAVREFAAANLRVGWRQGVVHPEK
jgi:excisionase family DNA binding protein